MPRPVVPTLPPPRRASLAPVERHVVRHDHVRARLTRTRETSMPRAASMSISSMSVAGLTTTPLPMTGVMCGWSTPDGKGGA